MQGLGSAGQMRWKDEGTRVLQDWQSFLASALQAFPSKMEKRWQDPPSCWSVCYSALNTSVYLFAKSWKRIFARFVSQNDMPLGAEEAPMRSGLLTSLHSPRTVMFTFLQTQRLPGPSTWVSGFCIPKYLAQCLTC